MAKEIIVLKAEEITAQLNASEEAIKAYRFASENAGLVMDDGQLADFVTRRNAMSGWRDLWEYKARLDMVSASIETVVKHAMNADAKAELPAGFSWKSGGSTYSIADGAAAIIVDTILRKNKMLKREDFLNVLDASKIAKVAGIKADKLKEMFPDVVDSKEKSPSLMVK